MYVHGVALFGIAVVIVNDFIGIFINSLLMMYCEEILCCSVFFLMNSNYEGNRQRGGFDYAKELKN
jgi:hypothetical protein